MKILLLSSEFPPRRGGIGTYSRELAEAAAGLGHQVTVLAADYGGDQSALDATFPFKVVRFKGRPHTMKQLPGKIALVSKFARQNPDFDIVHACDWPFYLPLALSAYRGKARCLLTFHGTEVRFMQNPKRAWLLRLIRFWNGWTGYIANSRYTGAALAKAFDLPEAEIRSIPLGVGTNWFEPTDDRADTRRRLEIAEDRFVIASLGRLVPRKGHLVLAQALALLPKDIATRIDWLIIGPAIDEDYAARLKTAIATSPVRARLMGSLEQGEVRAALKASDLFCLPGFIDETGAVEGFGLVYLEAAALGLASVASASGGVPDAIDDGVTGLLTPPNDPAAIAGAIERLFLDRAMLGTLSRNALARARLSGWANVASRTYDQP